MTFIKTIIALLISYNIYIITTINVLSLTVATIRSKDLAKEYIQNWQEHRGHSEAYGGR